MVPKGNKSSQQFVTNQPSKEQNYFSLAKGLLIYYLKFSIGY